MLVSTEPISLFYYHRPDSKRSSIMMTCCSLKEAPLPWELSLTSDLSIFIDGWYILQSIAGDARKIIGFLYRTSKCLTPLAMLCFYKSRIWLKMPPYPGWKCPILTLQPWIQKRLCRFFWGGAMHYFPNYNPHPTDKTSLIYRYFHDKRFDQLHSLVLSALTFTPKSRHSTHTLERITPIPFVSH